MAELRLQFFCGSPGIFNGVMQQGGHNEVFVYRLDAVGEQSRDFNQVIDVRFAGNPFAFLVRMFFCSKLGSGKNALDCWTAPCMVVGISHSVNLQLVFLRVPQYLRDSALILGLVLMTRFGFTQPSATAASAKAESLLDTSSH